MRAARSVQSFGIVTPIGRKGRELPFAFAAFALIEINDKIIMELAFNELHQIYERAA
jgi:hypothetical protein